MPNTKLVRTRVGGDPHVLVVRSSTDDPTPLDLAVAADPDAVLAVTFGDSDRLFGAWRERADRQPRDVGVVEVGSTMRSAGAVAAPAAGPVVSGVPDPSDLAAVRDAMASYLDAWPARGRTVAYVDSVTALLARAGVDAATEFLSAAFRLLGERDAAGYFPLTPSACDRAAVRAVGALFDTVVECVDPDDEVNDESGIVQIS
ncbi:hypothetical protein NGM10_00100 [Halorussus salilacus]|uniref:DUF7504 family protein n=1 Tax=Halorussus salilacus TaxID=2953750 RepID=UPI00209E4FFB|nr:hypothetical protein [Halorussus salilacus]USZ68160.1 hypothetical protein NGM10_00100 [Halorussus salilacus]